MRKVLTPELISAKTRCDNVALIKNLNLWGNDIEDVRLLRQMPSLEILSLSVNRISSLREFSSCRRLQELYLRKNSISDLNEVLYLSELPDLRILWLLDNPCSEQENYRQFVISSLPGLRKLDNNDVTEEERRAVRTPPERREPGRPAGEEGRPGRKEKEPVVEYNKAVKPKKEPEMQDQRKDNVLCAVLALIKELDLNELEFLKRDIDRKLGGSRDFG